MDYVLVRWPEDKPGLVFGIVPANVFDEPYEIFRNPYTNDIPISIPNWGTMQHITVPWSDKPFLSTLVSYGNIELIV